MSKQIKEYAQKNPSKLERGRQMTIREAAPGELELSDDDESEMDGDVVVEGESPFIKHRASGIYLISPTFGEKSKIKVQNTNCRIGTSRNAFN